jgi:hypothetical protein
MRLQLVVDRFTCCSIVTPENARDRAGEAGLNFTIPDSIKVDVAMKYAIIFGSVLSVNAW